MTTATKKTPTKKAPIEKDPVKKKATSVRDFRDVLKAADRYGEWERASKAGKAKVRRQLVHDLRMWAACAFQEGEAATNLPADAYGLLPGSEPLTDAELATKYGMPAEKVQAALDLTADV